jgi:type II secretory pathway pseudopilin PulG
MILSFDESAMRQSLRLAKQGRGSLGEKPAYRERVAALGETGIFLYSDPSRRLKDLLPLINIGIDAALQREETSSEDWAQDPTDNMPARMTPLEKMRAMGLSVHDIPNPYILCDYLTPSAVGLRAEENYVDLIAISGEGATPLPMVGGMLAAIAVPNFLEAQKRAKVARAMSDVRTLTVALEAYRIDMNAYPIPVDEVGVQVKPDENGVLTGFLATSLTTPIEYIVDLPMDPFAEGYTYRYSTDLLRCWILGSPGPDKVMDGDISAYPDMKRGSCDLTKFLSSYGQGGEFIVYDTSNGTVSPGDVIRVGP